MNWSEIYVPAGKVIVDFHVLSNEVNVLNNVTISTYLQSLPLAMACLVLTQTINLNWYWTLIIVYVYGPLTR